MEREEVGGSAAGRIKDVLYPAVFVHLSIKQSLPSSDLYMQYTKERKRCFSFFSLAVGSANSAEISQNHRITEL